MKQSKLENSAHNESETIEQTCSLEKAVNNFRKTFKLWEKNWSGLCRQADPEV